jgi:hypothetical protein
MRKLKTSDIPGLCRCLKKLGLQDQYLTIAAEANNIKDVARLGIDFFWGLFDAATEESGEFALYEFLAGPFEMTPEEVRDLDIDKLLENLKQLATENNLLPFFKSAAKLMK